MTRIGIIGLENSHVDHFIRLLNNEQRHPGTLVTALVGGEPDRRQDLCRSGGIEVVLDTPAELVDRVDAVIISSRDGRLHRDQALPIIEAGIPVLIDKPLAASVGDAEILLAAAERANTLLLSSSALRHVPEIASLAAGTDERGATQVVEVIGPADPASEYAGLFFYGIHIVEIALQLAGDGSFGHVHVQRTPDSIVAITMIEGIQVVMTFVTPDAVGQVRFHATIVGRRGLHTTPLTLSRDYNAPVLDLFVSSIGSGTSPVSHAALLRPVSLLEAITNQL